MFIVNYMKTWTYTLSNRVSIHHNRYIILLMKILPGRFSVVFFKPTGEIGWT
jgi:hypothetical protein